MHTGQATHSNATRITASASGNLANASTTFFPIGGGEDIITAIQVSWPDAVSAATITLESTNFGTEEATDSQAAGFHWYVEPVVITGPVAAAAGTFMLHVGNGAARRYRLKVVTTAITQLYLRVWGTH